MHKIKILDDECIPHRASLKAGALDLKSRVSCTIPPYAGRVAKIPLGFSVEVDPDFVLKIYPRGGLSLRYPNYIANNVGIVDEDYRGEVIAEIVNNSKEYLYIAKGDRIAQGIFERSEVTFELTDTLSTTERGDGGSGSTG